MPLELAEALTKMEKVAEYINEMQRVYEEYGAVFNQIQSQCQQSRDVSITLGPFRRRSPVQNGFCLSEVQLGIE